MEERLKIYYHIDMKTKRVLSLFSGCGGMDLGFEGDFDCFKCSVNEFMHPDWIEKDYGDKVRLKKTGFKTVFANDIRPDAKIAWTTYFSKNCKGAEEIFKLGSIVDLVKEEKENHNVFPKDIDIVTGGFPCQDFSVAGKRQGFNSKVGHDGRKIAPDEPTEENRGKLYMWMRDVVSIVKPKVFIAENVKGLTNLNDVKEIIESDFANAAEGGYLVIPARVLQAANYGVPQSRERVIFYGFKKEALAENALHELSSINISLEYDPYPQPTHNYNLKDEIISNKLKPFATCIDVLNDLDEPDVTIDKSQKCYSKAKFDPKGQGNIEIKLNGIAPTIRSEHHGNIEYRRLSLEHGGTHLDELNQKKVERRLTIRECARIQTFPDDYQFIMDKKTDGIDLSASNSYKLIGNAVPCILGYNIAMTLAEKWDLYFKK